MSKELSVKGEVVGTERYFKELNSMSDMSVIFERKEKYNYYDSIKRIVSKIKEAFDAVYNDLKSNAGIIRYIPDSKRKTFTNFVLNLKEIGKSVYSLSGKESDIISVLQLSDSMTKLRSNSSDSDIQKSFEYLRRGDFKGIYHSEAVSLISKAISSGVEYITRDNQVYKQFFLGLSKDSKLPSKEYLYDLLTKYTYHSKTSDFRGKNGKELCSDDYIEYFIKYIFGKSFSKGLNFNNTFNKMMADIGARIDNDLTQGLRNNDYITDKNAAIMKEAIKELEKCGVRCSGLIDKVEKLAWFVGGNPNKIRELQRLLNRLNFPGKSGQLLEDGVYGKETLFAWIAFNNQFSIGTLPTLTWIDPLKNNLVEIAIGSTKSGKAEGLTNAFTIGRHPFIRIDPPHNNTGYFRGEKTKIDYNHINFDKLKNTTWIYEKIREKYNHYPLTDEAYDFLKNLKDRGKTIRIAGKIFLVADIVLDALELGMAIESDLKDADKKIGKKTVSTAASIGGSWSGAVLGAKLGAIGGGFTGPAAPIFVPLLSIIGGVAGAFGGDAFAKWVVDITYVGE